MVKTEYNPETDELTLVIETGVGPVTETVDFKEFMDGIPTERARVDYLLSKVKDVKENRITKAGEFMGIIEGIMAKQQEIRKRMDEAAESGDHKAVRSLSMVHKALLDEKNTIREIRYAIKLLEGEEGRLLSQLLELTA